MSDLSHSIDFKSETSFDGAVTSTSKSSDFGNVSSKDKDIKKNKPSMKMPTLPAARPKRLPTVNKKVNPSNSQTPKKKASAPKKACSTPTNDDVTISDMTLDASCINTLNRTHMPSTVNILDESAVVDVGSKRSKGLTKPGGPDYVKGGKTRFSNRRHTMVPNTNNQSGGKATESRLNRTNTLGKSRIGSINRNRTSNCSDDKLDTDEEEITDEMIDEAYTRYIQAKFIELKSSQALEKAERECASQLYEAFSATEKLRQEVMRLEDEDLLQSNIAVVKDTLNLIDLKIKPILKEYESFNIQLASTAAGLESVKHYLTVKGINLPDQEASAREMEKLAGLFRKFNADVVGARAQIAGSLDIQRTAELYSTLAEKYENILAVLKNCSLLHEEASDLVEQETSLIFSMNQLAVARAKLLKE